MRIEAQMEQFKERCQAAGLAVTHQRTMIYRELVQSLEHPSPELIFDRVRGQIPSLSLATVYKSIRTFADLGLVREVNPFTESQRWDANLDPHHHLICTQCKSVSDIPADAVEPVQFRSPLPEQFQVQRLSVEVLGLCAACTARKRESQE
jgi:Fur family transcriptional regulator, peroxide stress response regulator